MDDRLTLGVEEEYQIVDAEGRLRAHIDMLMAEAEPRLGELVKPEFLQSEVEVGTKICADVAEARTEVTRLRATLSELLAGAGLRLASAGTNPISHWHDQKITENDRYKLLEEEMQDVARELLIFGLHVHVGIPDPDLRIEIVNEARYFLPHMLALSASPASSSTGESSARCRCAIWPRSGSSSSTTSWTSSARARIASTFERSSNRAPAPIGRSPSTSGRVSSPPWSTRCARRRSPGF